MADQNIAKKESEHWIYIYQMDTEPLFAISTLYGDDMSILCLKLVVPPPVAKEINKRIQGGKKY